MITKKRERWVLIPGYPRKKKNKGKEEREGEREKEEGAGRRWLRWPPSHAGGIPVTAVSPEN